VSLIQSNRDNIWWPYIEITGPAEASVALNVSKGVFTYQTTVTKTALKMRYSKEYVARYGNPGTFPAGTLEESVRGKQAALSGSVTWPAVNLDTAGVYRVDGLRWFDKTTFVMPWSLVTNSSLKTNPKENPKKNK
jgi:hypothetical protein